MLECGTEADDPAQGTTLNAILLIHDRLATSVMLFMVAAGLWGLVAFLRGGTLSGSLAGALVIGQALVTLQVLAGVVLALGGAPVANTTHYLYGATAILSLPFAWSYFRSRDQRQALLVYSLVALFVFGLAVRGSMTAS